MNCILIDDDPVSVEQISILIEKTPSLELVKVFREAEKAMSYLKRNTVDVLFLDVNLPDISGLDMLKSLKDAPRTVLISGSSDHALEAFDLNVVDYLLKPVKYNRFLQSSEKVEEIILKEAEDHVPTGQKDYVFLKMNSKLHGVYTKDIVYVEAKADYALVALTDGKSYIVHSSMKKLETVLPELIFSRVHKSYIVNTKHVQLIKDNYITLGNDMEVPIGMAFKKSFIKKITVI